MECMVKGQFDMAGLPQLVNDFSQHYFDLKMQQSIEPGAPISDSLAFGMTISKPEIFTAGLLPGLYGLESFTLSGSLDGRSRRFNFSTNLPLATYDVWTVENLLLHAKGNGQTANFSLEIPTVQQYEEQVANNLSMTASFDGNRADMLLAALDSTGKERFEIGVFAKTDDFKKGATIRLLPTQLINYQEWKVPMDNKISYDDQKNFHPQFTVGKWAATPWHQRIGRVCT